MNYSDNFDLKDIVYFCEFDLKTKTEQWRGVVGFEDRYLVSDLGRIKSLPKKIKMPRGGFKVTELRIMKPPINQYGYEYIAFWNGAKRKNIQVHRAVAIAFIENPKNKLQVNHKKGIKIHNRVVDLEWATPQENMDHALLFGLAATGERIKQSKLKHNQVGEIKNKYSAGGVTYLDLAKEYNVSFSIIGQIVRNEIWLDKTNKQNELI